MPQLRKWTIEDLQNAVLKGKSYCEVARLLGLSSKSSNGIRKEILKNKIDISHWRKNRRGCCRTWTDEELSQMASEAISFRQLLKLLNLRQTGGNYKSIKHHVKRLNIDTSHWLGCAHLRGKRHPTTPRQSLSEILVENSEYKSTSKLNKRLVAEGILKPECSICTLTTWQDKEISLHLDHINGINNDNRLENLRLLCPNCHSQTSTYCRRKSALEGIG